MARDVSAVLQLALHCAKALKDLSPELFANHNEARELENSASTLASALLRLASNTAGNEFDEDAPGLLRRFHSVNMPRMEAGPKHAFSAASSSTDCKKHTRTSTFSLVP